MLVLFRKDVDQVLWVPKWFKRDFTESSYFKSATSVSYLDSYIINSVNLLHSYSYNTLRGFLSGQIQFLELPFQFLELT